MKRVAVSLLAVFALFAQDESPNRKPSPFNATAQTTRAARSGEASDPGIADDPFADLLNAAIASEKEWKALDMSLVSRLEGVGVCSGDPARLINDAAAGRVRSLAAWAEYYRKHQERWRDIMQSVVNMAADRGPDRSEIATSVQVLRREKGDMERRLRDLAASVAGRETPESRQTIADLEGMIERRALQIARPEKTLVQFDAAQGYLKERREGARTRLRELSELIADLRGESLLWEHLYGSILHSSELKCDKAIPPVGTHDVRYGLDKDK